MSMDLVNLKEYVKTRKTLNTEDIHHCHNSARRDYRRQCRCRGRLSPLIPMLSTDIPSLLSVGLRLLIGRSEEAVKKFYRLATNIWGIVLTGKTDKEIVLEGLERMEDWMCELGLAMNITECGADASKLEGMADACPITESGYVILTREGVINVLRQTL